MIEINTKYYNASNNFSAPIKREPRPYNPYMQKSEIITPTKPNETEDFNETPLPIETKNNKAVQELSLKTDDLLLIGLIILLLPNAKDNLILILVLGYLLISGIE